MSSDLAARLDPVRASLGRLASTMYTLESDPDVSFVSGRGAAGGLTTAIETLWARYPAAKETVDRAEAALAADDRAAVEELLGEGALARLVDELAAEADRVLGQARAVAGAARASITAIDTAARSVGQLEARAAALGANDEPELAAARAALDRATAAVTDDPTVGIDPAPIDRAVVEAGRLVDELERRRSALPGALTEARQRMADIDRLAAEGHEALAAARDKIARPAGLLEPLDGAVLDRPPQGLRPWLARLEALAADGQWRSASVGLDGWRGLADAWWDNAKQVVSANRAPVARRNELRGLLEAYEAKAAAIGKAEDPQLLGLRTAAHDALFGAPCDLVVAERLVFEFARALNAPRTSSQP